MTEQKLRPTVSVIVPVRDGLDELRTCVTALLAQDYPADRFEVIVADNGSAVFPGPLLPADQRLTVLSEPTPGSYTARNAALAVATGEIIAFTDADCRPEPGWLSAAVDALEADPPADMVAGAIQLFFADGTPHTGPEWFEQLNGFPVEEYLRRGFAVTANMVTRRSVFDRVGPFDASLASGGDAEWCRRIRDYGGIQRSAPLAKVFHPARATRADLLKKSRRTTVGVATKALRRPGGRRQVGRMLLGQVKAALRLTLTVWFAPRPDSFTAKVRYLGIFWSNTGAVVGELIRSLRKGAQPA